MTRNGRNAKQEAMVAIDCPEPHAGVVAADLRAALADAGYTADALATACGCNDLGALVDGDGALVDRCGGGPLAALVRLLLAGGTLERGAAVRALGVVALDACARLGIVADADGWVVARARVVPVDGLLVVSDFARGSAEGFRVDHVAGPTASSLTLAALTVRSAHRRTLDVATGSGVQALLAARHSDAVVATDRNARAVAFAAFNAWLNDTPNVTAVRGDFLTGFRPGTFGLVVCMPPFVVAPMRRRPFTPGDGRADDLARDLVVTVPDALADGGLAQLMLHWVHVGGEDPIARVAAWCDGSGCDALLVRTETLDADAYVARWSDAPGAEAWRRYLARIGVDAVSAGVLTLRRRAGRSWFRAVDAPARIAGGAGDDVLRMIAGVDVAVAPDDVLLASTLQLRAEARLEQHCVPGHAGWRVDGSTLHLDRPLAFVADVAPWVAVLLGRCDGRHALGALLDDSGAARGGDAVAVAHLLADVRRLLERGFLFAPRARSTPG